MVLRAESYTQTCYPKYIRRILILSFKGLIDSFNYPRVSTNLVKNIFLTSFTSIILLEDTSLSMQVENSSGHSCMLIPTPISAMKQGSVSDSNSVLTSTPDTFLSLIITSLIHLILGYSQYALSRNLQVDNPQIIDKTYKSFISRVAKIVMQRFPGGLNQRLFFCPTPCD